MLAVGVLALLASTAGTPVQQPPDLRLPIAEAVQLAAEIFQGFGGWVSYGASHGLLLSDDGRRIFAYYPPSTLNQIELPGGHRWRNPIYEFRRDPSEPVYTGLQAGGFHRGGDPDRAFGLPNWLLIYPAALLRSPSRAHVVVVHTTKIASAVSMEFEWKVRSGVSFIRVATTDASENRSLYWAPDGWIIKYALADRSSDRIILRIDQYDKPDATKRKRKWLILENGKTKPFVMAKGLVTYLYDSKRDLLICMTELEYQNGNPKPRRLVLWSLKDHKAIREIPPPGGDYAKVRLTVAALITQNRLVVTFYTDLPERLPGAPPGLELKDKYHVGLYVMQLPDVEWVYAGPYTLAGYSNSGEYLLLKRGQDDPRWLVRVR
ncbi:MAG: hypothetical protein IH851_02405 [Armatimonadetes bacterium]|nr:hypothetical protein [Armatimonadota bacterium]